MPTVGSCFANGWAPNGQQLFLLARFQGFWVNGWRPDAKKLYLVQPLGCRLRMPKFIQWSKAVYLMSMPKYLDSATPYSGQLYPGMLQKQIGLDP